MKNYNQFLNEDRRDNYWELDRVERANLQAKKTSIGKFNKNLPEEYEFAIDVENGTKKELEKAIKEIEKFVEIDDYVKPFLLNNKKWCAWIIRIHAYGPPNYKNLSITFDWAGFSESIYEDIIPLKEFLNVGLEGVKDYFEIQDNVNKYNL